MGLCCLRFTNDQHLFCFHHKPSHHNHSELHSISQDLTRVPHPKQLAPEARVLAYLEDRTLRCPGLCTRGHTDASLPVSPIRTTMPLTVCRTSSLAPHQFVCSTTSLRRSVTRTSNQPSSSLVVSHCKDLPLYHCLTLSRSYHLQLPITASTLWSTTFLRTNPFRNTFPDNPRGPETITQVS